MVEQGIKRSGEKDGDGDGMGDVVTEITTVDGRSSASASNGIQSSSKSASLGEISLNGVPQ